MVHMIDFTVVRCSEISYEMTYFEYIVVFITVFSWCVIHLTHCWLNRTWFGKTKAPKTQLIVAAQSITNVNDFSKAFKSYAVVAFKFIWIVTRVHVAISEPACVCGEKNHFSYLPAQPTIFCHGFASKRYIVNHKIKVHPAITFYFS